MSRNTGRSNNHDLLLAMSPQTLPAKTFILLCAVLVISTVAFFLLPMRGHHQDDLSLAAYYAGTDGLTGQELREKLHSTLEAGHTVVRYSGTTSGVNDVWSALMAANEDPDNGNNVFLIYWLRSESKSNFGMAEITAGPRLARASRATMRTSVISRRSIIPVVPTPLFVVGIPST